MRILHLSTRLILGGSQENTILSCEGQLTAGHDVHLAFGPIFGPEGSMLERAEAFRPNIDSERSIETHEIPNLVRELSPRKDWRAYLECRNLIRRLKPDIVHTHSSKAGIVGRAAAWAEGGRAGQIGVVHTIHGLPFHPYEKRWRNGIYIRSERWAANRCHGIVTVCNAMRDQALDEQIGSPQQYTTVYSGMEVEQFVNPERSRESMRTELGLEDRDFVVGTIARLAELKGHDDLIDALADRLKEKPHWKLLWVGDGWWADRLAQRLVDHGIEGQVIRPGLVDSDEVSNYVAAMDVLVHPSYREGLPRTVPQALLGSVPVVVYDVDGAPEVCIPNQTGILVKPGDIEGLRDAVDWMFEHPDERQRFGKAGYQLCVDQFDTQKMVDDLEVVYQRCLDGIRS